MSSPFKQLWSDVVGGGSAPQIPAPGAQAPVAPGPSAPEQPQYAAPPVQAGHPDHGAPAQPYQAPADPNVAHTPKLSPPPPGWGGQGPGGTVPLDAVPGHSAPAYVAPAYVAPAPVHAAAPAPAYEPPVVPAAQPVWHDPPARPVAFPQERAQQGYAEAAAYVPPFVNPNPAPKTSDTGSGFGPWLAALGAALGCLLVALIVVGSSVSSAKQRLLHPDEKPGIAIAQQAEVAYCTKDFKTVLERVLHSCGLSTQTERRGCKPADIKTFAAISDDDFNSLFHPLKDRGGVLMFAEGSEELDAASKKLLEERWFDRKGARYFFVVARASKTGTADKNRALSHRRANSVLFHLKQVSGESEQELNTKVGLLWLGNEYAQLSQDYCSWPHAGGEAQAQTSKAPAGGCDDEAINRSAFVSWVDCRL